MDNGQPDETKNIPPEARMNMSLQELVQNGLVGEDQGPDNKKSRDNSLANEENSSPVPQRK